MSKKKSKSAVDKGSHTFEKSGSGHPKIFEGLIGFRKTERRVKDWERLKKIRPFSEYQNDAKIFDTLIQVATTYPERFTSSFTEDEHDVFELIQKMNELFIERINIQTQMLKKLWNKLEDIEGTVEFLKNPNRTDGPTFTYQKPKTQGIRHEEGRDTS